MTVYDFLSLATDLSGVCVRVFDLTREDIVFDSDSFLGYADPLRAIEFLMSCYEVESYDIYLDSNGKLTLELNIEMDEEDGDEE